MSKTKADLQAEIRELKKKVRSLQKTVDNLNRLDQTSDVDIKNYFAALGRRGGRIGSDRMTPAQRSERARKAVAAREAKKLSVNCPSDASQQSVPDRTSDRKRGGGK